METILAWDSKSYGGKMPEGYRHLTCEQRCQIYALLQSGHSQAHIARAIGVRQKIQQAEGQEFGAWVDSEPRRHRSATFRCRRKKPHRRLGGRHNYRCQSQRRCHVACRAKIQIHQAAKLPDKSADSVVQACARVLLPLADRIETITYDNGKEFASHVKIATSLGSLSYFAKPYHSWERGLNEHTNGLFRQYFPKGSDLSILSDADVQRVEAKLNSRPRKILGYRTPREVFVNANNLPVALHC